MHLKGMCIPLFWGGLFYEHQKILLADGVIQLFYVLVNFLSVYNLLLLLITERGMLKSPSIILNCSFFPFSSLSFCLMYFKGLLLDANTFRVIRSSW